MNRPPLIIFGPLPPARNGLADYIDGLLPYLDHAYRCLVVLADDAPLPDPVPAEIIYESEYRRFNAFAHERHLYQLGNNSGLAYVLPMLDRVPGLVTIHDVTLYGLISSLLPGGRRSEEFVELAGIAEGKTGETVASLASLEVRGSEVGAVELPLLSLVARRSKALISHSLLAKSRLDGLSGCPVINIPCFAPVPRSNFLGDHKAPSPPRSGRYYVEILCVGFVARGKRIDLVLRAVKELARIGIPIRLTIAGERRPDEYDVEADITRLGLGEQCRLLDYLSENELSAAIATADILANLRLPTYGESSGPLLRALWLGTCALVTDVGSFAELPDDAVIKVKLKDMTGEGIAKRLLPFVLDAARREEVGRRARDYAHSTLSPARAAELYVQAIESVADITSVSHSPGCVEYARVPRIGRGGPAAAAEAEDIRSFNSGPSVWWQDAALPVNIAGGRLLIVGGDVHTISATEAFGWMDSFCWNPAGKMALSSAEVGLFAGALVLTLPADEAAIVDLLKKIASAVIPMGPILIDFIEPPYWRDVISKQMLQSALEKAGLSPIDGWPISTVPRIDRESVAVARQELCLLVVNVPGKLPRR